jgi:CRP-like cAMP-binding protein
VEFRNHLLSTVLKADGAALIPGLTEMSLDRGQVLFEPGERAVDLYFPSNAVLSVVTVMSDGVAVESSTIGHEAAAPLLAALADGPVSGRIFAQIGGGAMRMSASALRSWVADRPAAMSLLLQQAGAMAFQAERGVACNAVHSAPKRLARWILMTQDRTGGRFLPLTQEYMAVMLGVQRTTISGIANQLRTAGLIRFSRGNLEVADREGLEAYACECYGAVRAEFDRIRKTEVTFVPASLSPGASAPAPAAAG